MKFKKSNAVVLLAIITCIISLFLPFFRAESGEFRESYFYWGYGYENSFAILLYIGLALMLFSMFVKQHVLKLRIVSASLSLAPMIDIIIIFLVFGGSRLMPPYVVPVELAHGFYVYAIGVVLLWLSLVIPKVAK